MNAIYGRRIVKKLGGDPSPILDDWCWRKFGEQYPELLEKAMEYFKGRKNSEAAYHLVRDCGAPVEWAQTVITDSTWAYCLVRDCGAPVEWAQTVITRSDQAYCLVYDCGAPVEWAQTVITESDWANCLVCDCGASAEWADKIKKERANG